MTALFGGIWLDIVFGDPHDMPHPIRAIGGLVSFLDTGMNSGKRRVLKGFTLWIIVMITVTVVPAVVVITSYRVGKICGVVIELIMTYYVLAAGSLRDESMNVYRCLDVPDNPSRTDEARYALSMIVGRDTDVLDEAGITRAAVETVAENTSDGVIAPLIYTAIGGPVLGFMYKAINTMDSMIGYHNEKYEEFGRFAARADDAANLIPSRLSALFMIAATAICTLIEKLSKGPADRYYSASGAFRIWRRDRRSHKSPNSAQTESVCAGALGLRLAGDASYGKVIVKKPFIGDDTRPVEAEDIKRAVRLMFVTEAVCTAVIFTITALILTFPSI